MQAITRQIRDTGRWAAWVGVLALAVGSAQAAPARSRLVALRKATGATLAAVPLWSVPANASGRPAVADDWVYFLEEGRSLCGLNLATGKVQWRTPIEKPTTWSPIVAGNLVCLSNGTSISAYMKTTGRHQWTSAISEYGPNWRVDERATYVSDGFTLVVASGSLLLCLNIEKGQPVWAHPNSVLAPGTTPVIVDPYVYVRRASEPTEWTRIRVEDGSTVWDDDGSYTLPGNLTARAPRSSLTPAKLSPDRRSLTVTAGKKSWSYRAPAPFTIGGVIGEAGDVICVQLVENAPRAAHR